MMKKLLSAFLAAGLLAALLAGCGNTEFERESSSVEMVPASSSEPASESQPEPEPMVEATPGEITGDIYTNDSLGIMMTLPEGWYHMSTDELKDLVSSSSATDVGGSEAEDSSVSESAAPSGSDSAQEEPVEGSSALSKGLVPLFWISESDPTADQTSNANMSFSAESVGVASGITSQVMTDYLAAVKQMYQSVKDVEGTEVRYTVRGPEVVDINGTEFQKLTATMSNITGTKMMTRDIYVCVDKGYMLNLTATYFDDEQRAVIDESVHSLTITA